MTQDMMNIRYGNSKRIAWRLFSFATICRFFFLMLLMMVLGVSGVKAETDYSGTYYIAYFGNNKYDPNDPANTNNHYWCPVDCSGTWKAWFKYNDDPNYDNYTKTENTGMEFLTTYRFKNDANYNSLNAVWVITKHETIANAYYIQHRASQKYLTLNDYMQGTTNTGQNRLRVHIQSAIASDDKSVFTIKMSNGYFLICPYTLDGTQWINMSTNPTNSTALNTDANSLVGTDTKGGVSGLKVGGTMGYYSSGDGDPNSKWYLEDYIKRPTIGFDDSDNDMIIIKNETVASLGTIYYTTNGDDPTLEASERESFDGASVTIESFTDNTVIKAVAKVGNEYSNVVTFTAYMHIGSGHQYLMQTVDGGSFYMVPPITTETNVSTTNIPHEKMAWYLSDAGQTFGYHYYYIVNTNTTQYLYCSGAKAADNAFVIKTANADGTVSARYRFMLVASEGGYNIIPEFFASETAGMCMNKKGGNNAATNLNLSDGTDDYSRWTFVQKPSDPRTLFDASFASTTASKKCYLIKSANAPTYHLMPPTTEGGYATVNKTGANPNWFLLPVDDNDEWIASYHIKNGKTGEYLYFNGTAGQNNENTFFTSSTIESGNENRYKFIIVRGTNTNYPDAYNIIPYALKDQANQALNSLFRNQDFTLRTHNSRNQASSLWLFEEVCLDPIFEKSGDDITISYISSTSDVYYTTDGSDPSTSGTLYDNSSWPASGKHGIRAIAKLKSNSSVTSEEVTLLNNPDIILDPAYDYGYDGNPKTPGATVLVGEVTAPTDAYTIEYSGDNVSVGTNTAIATIQDVTDDSWYIWGNLSVTFSITLPTVSFTVSIANWTYGGTASTPSVSGNPDGTDDQITYEYKLKDAGSNTYSSTVPTNAGDYVIKATLPGSTTYGESVATTDFVINKSTLTVTGSGSKHYGEDDPAPIAYTVDGLASWDTESEILTGSLIRATGENTGTYDITQGTLTLSENAKAANYTLVFAGGTFRIIGTDITVTLSLDGWTYGDDVNAPSIEVTDPTDYPISTATVKYYYKKKSETVDKYTETVPINAGTYNVKVVIDPNVSYEGAEKDTEFTIGRAAISITADDKVKGYGDNDPELTYTVSGLKYSDSEYVVLSCELQRTPGEGMGNYTIKKTTPDKNIVKSGNYSFSSFTEATFTITAKSLGNSVTLEPASGIRIYAIKNGEDSWTVSVYNNETVFTENTDYTSQVTGPDNGIYTIVVNAVENSKCTGSAKATYFDVPFNTISATEKVAPYITTITDQVTATVGVRPYIISKVNPSQGTVTVVPVSYIPKDVPVLLLADNNATGVTVIPKNDDIYDIPENTLKTNNLMYASQNKEVANAEVYVYYEGEFVLALEGTLTPGHFYLYNPNYIESETPDPTSNPAPSFNLMLIKDGSTGMMMLTNDAKKERENDIWYSIDGRRLNSKPTKKGLYIRNNQKVVVR